MELKPEIIVKIKNDSQLKFRIMEIVNKSYPTIQRWLNQNNTRLTNYSILILLSQTFDKDISELLN